MITLYNFGPIDDVCDPSPFCVKVEAYMRMTGLAYETKSGVEYLRSAPKGKLPYIEDNGQLIPDSAFILNYLKATYGDQMDADLSLTEKSIAHAYGRMIDEHMYWILAYARWQLPQNQPIIQARFFSGLSFPMNKLIAYKAKRDVRIALYKQGIGRHSDADIFDAGSRDLTALSDLLGGKPYFFGASPTTIDALAYSILSQFIKVTAFSSPIFDKARTYQNLVDFTDRFHQRYFEE